MFIAPFVLLSDPNPKSASLRNLEPAIAPATMTSVIDETLYITAGSAADFSGWRTTAVPAGSRGRVTISGRQMMEAGTPVRFNVAHFQPDNTFTPIPADHAAIDAGMAYWARCGYNAVRVMGIEHLIMRGQDGAATFNLELLDRFDYFLYSAKAYGMYWVMTLAQSYNLFRDMDGSLDRYTWNSASNGKQRIFVEQGWRDNWTLGVDRIYNRVNPYTGINILQDPALLMAEIYNESSAQFCGEKEVPAAWLTRASGATPCAMTWGEWLADPTKAHGYANIAALNASWGTSHASIAAAAAAQLTLMEISAVLQTVQTADFVLYQRYIEADLAAFYGAALDAMGYTGIRSLHTMYPSTGEIASSQILSSVNHVGNWHYYDNLSNSRNPPILLQRAESPHWDYEYLLMQMWGAGSRPLWLGEAGSITWTTWRDTWPLYAAAAASAGAVSITNFIEGDPFTSAYFNDTTPHGDRIKKLDNFVGPGAHTRDFCRLLLAAMFLRGDVDELSETGAIAQTLSDRFFGVNPKSAGRIKRYLEGLYRPMSLASGIVKARLNWTSDTADDTLSATSYAKSWFDWVDGMRAAGAITTSHPAWVNANANRGTVTAIATTGTVGGLAASPSQPVLTLSAAHTLVDDDLINVSNISGTAGNNLRSNRTRVKIGTGTNVRAESGLDLTSYSGYATATWCDSGNVMASAHEQWGWSRRDKCGWISTARTIFFASQAGATFPRTYGVLTITAIDANVSVAAVSLDGLPLASSRHIALGLCGVAENTGMTFSDATRQTCTALGTYPVQQRDATAQIELQLATPLEWTLYRCARSGDRTVRESLDLVNVSTGRLLLTLRVGVVQPTCLWELVR